MKSFLVWVGLLGVLVSGSGVAMAEEGMFFKDNGFQAKDVQRVHWGALGQDEPWDHPPHVIEGEKLKKFLDLLSKATAKTVAKASTSFELEFWLEDGGRKHFKASASYIRPNLAASAHVKTWFVAEEALKPFFSK